MAQTPAATASKGKEISNSESINNIQEGGHQNSNPSKPRPQMKFDDIGMTTEECFDGLVKKGVIIPVTNYVTKPDADMTKYCRFHQGHGHVTNNCFTLKRIIQGLVDAKKLLPAQKPNTVSNPLPSNTNT